MSEGKATEPSKIEVLPGTQEANSGPHPPVEHTDEVELMQTDPEPSAPMHQPISEAPDAPEMVHLPATIADEYGMSRSEARMLITTGIVEIDGEEQPARQMDFKEEDLLGKQITVKGDLKTVNFTYRGPQRDRYTGDRFA